INNSFKPAPATPKNSPVGHRILKPESGRSKLPYKVYGRAYVDGNIMEGYPHITADNWAGGVQVENLDGVGENEAYMRQKSPLIMPELTIVSAKDAMDFVLNNVGATLPKRDPVDARIVKEVREGKATALPNVKLPETQFKHRRLPIDSYKIGIITDPSQVGGYPEYKGTPYKDSDNDGMPDAYEKKMGLNPNDPSDASQYSKSGSGYTNIEEYLNSLVDINTVVPLKKM